MVVHNFYFVRVLALPAEAEPPLVIDADAVSALLCAFQGFQPVARRHPQVRQGTGNMQLGQLAQGHAFNRRRQAVIADALPKAFRFLAGETRDHVGTVSGADMVVKRVSIRVQRVSLRCVDFGPGFGEVGRT